MNFVTLIGWLLAAVFLGLYLVERRVSYAGVVRLARAQVEINELRVPVILWTSTHGLQALEAHGYDRTEGGFVSHLDVLALYATETAVVLNVVGDADPAILAEAEILGFHVVWHEPDRWVNVCPDDCPRGHL